LFGWHFLLVPEVVGNQVALTGSPDGWVTAYLGAENEFPPLPGGSSFGFRFMLCRGNPDYRDIPSVGLPKAVSFLYDATAREGDLRIPELQ